MKWKMWYLSNLSGRCRPASDALGNRVMVTSPLLTRSPSAALSRSHSAATSSCAKSAGLEIMTSTRRGGVTVSGRTGIGRSRYRMSGVSGARFKNRFATGLNRNSHGISASSGVSVSRRRIRSPASFRNASFKLLCRAPSTAPENMAWNS